MKTEPKLIVENVRNSFRWLERDDRNQPMTFIAQWNDDMHHVLDYIVTGDGRMTGYDDPAKDPIADFEKALVEGFVHDPERGRQQRWADPRRGRRRAAARFLHHLRRRTTTRSATGPTASACRGAPGRSSSTSSISSSSSRRRFRSASWATKAICLSGFPFFVDLDEEAAKAKRDDRYKQIREIFNQPEVKDGDLPEPNDPATFESAKLPWEDYHSEEHRRAIERFRELADLRRKYVWPLTATPCLDARSARKGNAIIVTWEFEAGHLTMAINPTGAPLDIDCIVMGYPVSSGNWSQHGDVLRLDAWTAVAWSSRF